eukprot:15465026-Alexandrium_andersonii.AAC.1
MNAGLNGLTGAASSGPPAGRNPMQPRRPHARTSAAAELAAPRPCSAPASVRRLRRNSPTEPTSQRPDRAPSGRPA